jgi:hypothetical protein
MNKKVVIIHFQPLELYPPVTNLMEVLTSGQDLNITVITTSNLVGLKQYKNDRISVIRYGGINVKQAFVIRVFRYVYFYIGSICNLLILHPGKILYYETLSSFPALLYHYLSFKRTKLLVHYHEYTSPDEYKTGMFLERWFHKLEQKVYPKVSWLSHTNEKRMGLFLNDHKGIAIKNPRIMPNYPPVSWAKQTKQLQSIPFPVKIVYVGSVSTDTMYFPEFIDWVIAQQGNVLFDIYSFEYSPEFRSYVEVRKSPYITLKGQLRYKEFLAVMNEYHIGVILYKGHIPNVEYCASNKLFEYLACGLDVWVSADMIGSKSFVTGTTYPKVTMVDFNNLMNLNLKELISHENLTYKASPYYCEPVYEKLSEHLCCE